MRRRPRQKDEKHLAFTRCLPCIVCLKPGTDAAHIRGADLKAGKRPTGMGEKPDDAFVLPVCRYHHQEQHNMNEATFWAGTNCRDPIRVALALYRISGDVELGEEIIMANQ